VGRAISQNRQNGCWTAWHAGCTTFLKKSGTWKGGTGFCREKIMANTVSSYQRPSTYDYERTLPSDTHWKSIGYLLWIFGFTGAHRFYYGKPITGTIWFLTLGLFGIGWLIDVLLIPRMDEEADLKFYPGPLDYNIAWALLTFLGMFGAHRFYMGKWVTGVIYLCTWGFFFVGWLYDLWTLNDQVSRKNLEW
jgi:TM2 domain-containing membrane protein YozV